MITAPIICLNHQFLTGVIVVVIFIVILIGKNYSLVSGLNVSKLYQVIQMPNFRLALSQAASLGRSIVVEWW